MTVDVKELHRAAATRHRGMGAQHDPERGAVDVRHILKVEDDFHGAGLDQAPDCVIEDGCPVCQRHPTADANQSDVGHESGIDMHTFTCRSRDPSRQHNEEPGHSEHDLQVEEMKAAARGEERRTTMIRARNDQGHRR